MDIVIQKGWDSWQSKSIAMLYEQAFGPKFAKAIPEKRTRIELLSEGFVPEFSFAALFQGDVIGLAGFQNAEGSLTAGIKAVKLIKRLGVIRGLYACLVLSLFHRQPRSQELVMDGIAVDQRFRGAGIGSRLLTAIISYAHRSGFKSVRLDVIDSNPRARKLYESKGFVAVKRSTFPYLKWLIGFSGSTTMILTL